MKKVGISMLTYNKADYINMSLESLRKQTFQNFEIFLVDDGSTDGKTPDILDHIEYDKIVFKKIYKTNKGLVRRREEQYARMQDKYEYILDFDADDFLDPTFLEKTVNYLDKAPQQCAAVCTNFKMFKKDPAKDVYGEHHYDIKKMTLPYLLANCYILGSSLMRSEALRNIKWNGGNLTSCPDWDRWICMAEHGYHFGLIEEPLFYYRQAESAMTHSIIAKNYYHNLEEIYNRHKRSYAQNIDVTIKDIMWQLAELLEGKNWLENQYNNLNEENTRLQNIISQTTLKKLIKKRLKNEKNKISHIFHGKDKNVNE